MFSDEATFKNNGELNRHNCHYWSEINRQWHREVDNQHRWSLMVWCEIINGYSIAAYFFKENVTGATYLQLLRDHLPNLLVNVDSETIQRIWIQQDAPPDFSNDVRDLLNLHYENRWIGRNGPVLWRARSLDLTSLDFNL